MTETEYLAIERAAEFKSEFYNGEMFAMSGAKYPHNRAKDNLASELNARLRSGPCYAITSDMRVKVDRTGLYTYPDIIVVCGDPELLDDRQDVLLNLTVIVEVLSPSTEKFDRGAKFRHYQQIPSLKEFILVAQDEAVCERFVRQADESWAMTSVVGLGGVLDFASVRAIVSMADLYRGVEFPTPYALRPDYPICER